MPDPDRKNFPARLIDNNATPPEPIRPDEVDEEEPDLRTIVREFVNGDLTLPDAVDAVATTLAAMYDIPWVPEALEERLLRAVADLVLQALDELAEALELRD